ncbi:hypothetical protein [Cellvibrio sp. OA-2007]|uniref:hypothetical protein n=1 Tax=Cellvibrio sp. OA-2007 TaxID=529823 RepID=UPI0007826477|nr:hypothetical protein [Cellvibrio sp. OA-2007]
MKLKFSLAFVVISIFILPFANAATQPAYSGRMNNTLGSIYQTKATKLGFAANDPRFTSSVKSISARSTALAGGFSGGILATAKWPRLLLTAGIFTLADIAQDLSTDPNLKVQWNDDQTLKLSGLPGNADYASFPICSTGQSLISSVGTSYDGFCVNTARNAFSRISTRSVSCNSGAAVQALCSQKTLIQYVNSSFSGAAQTPLSSYPYWRITNAFLINSTEDTNSYNVVYSYVAPSGVVLTPPSPATESLSPEAALAALPEAYMNKPLSDEQIANAANTMLQNAHAHSPLAMPELAANPVTLADVNAWRIQNPQAIPTVADLFSPVAAPGSGSVLIPNPAVDPTAEVTPGTQVINVEAKVEWGVFTPPTLDETPTANNILDPLFNFFPSWADYSMPSHHAECPQPQFTVFGHTYTFDQLCTYAEMMRPQLQAIFMVCWTIVVFFIILSA